MKTVSIFVRDGSIVQVGPVPAGVRVRILDVHAAEVVHEAATDESRFGWSWWLLCVLFGLLAGTVLHLASVTLL